MVETRAADGSIAHKVLSEAELHESKDELELLWRWVDANRRYLIEPGPRALGQGLWVRWLDADDDGDKELIVAAEADPERAVGERGTPYDALVLEREGAGFRQVGTLTARFTQYVHLLTARDPAQETARGPR